MSERDDELRRRSRLTAFSTEAIVENARALSEWIRAGEVCAPESRDEWADFVLGLAEKLKTTRKWNTELQREARRR